MHARRLPQTSGSAHHPRTLQDGTSAPFAESVQQAHHSSLTLIQPCMLFNSGIHVESHRFITGVAPHLPVLSQVSSSQFFLKTDRESEQGRLKV
jgi:hypothetical protein